VACWTVPMLLRCAEDLANGKRLLPRAGVVGCAARPQALRLEQAGETGVYVYYVCWPPASVHWAHSHLQQPARVCGL
jgi:hypothetical protein